MRESIGLIHADRLGVGSSGLLVSPLKQTKTLKLNRDFNLRATK